MIYKYPVNGKYLTLPIDSRFLHVAYQDHMMHVWIELGKSEETLDYVVDYVGTGWEQDTSDKAYIGSVDRDGFVWHVFYQELNNV